MLVEKADFGTGKPFLKFETLTLAPIDRALIDPALMRPDEIAWLDDYHARVLREVGPRLEPQAAAWLAQACAPLEHSA